MVAQLCNRLSFSSSTGKPDSESVTEKLVSWGAGGGGGGVEGAKGRD